jgi:PTS system beta-glucosides-specific IIC component
MSKKDYKPLAEQIIALVGGKENISNVTHCMTRLRFDLKDMSLPKTEELKKVPGVLGVVENGGQYQIIIGQNVPFVYKEVCALAGIQESDAIDENLDGEKKGFSLKRIGSGILNYLSACMSDIIPIFMGAALFKTVAIILGPSFFNVIAEDSDAYITLTMLYNVGFYFLPVYLGYAAAKKLKCSVPIGIGLGAMLLIPDFTGLIGVQDSISIYGLFSVPVLDYSQTMFPVLIGVWIMSYVERFLRRYIPEAISTVFVPFFTLVIMAPIMFGICAPLGNYLGEIIGTALVALGNSSGILSILGQGIIAAFWSFLVMGGMHGIIVTTGIVSLMTNGFDGFVLHAAGVATWAVFGMALGAFLKMKKKENKSLAMGYFLSGLLGGITEPALYGIGLKYKKPLISLIVAGFVAGCMNGIFNVATYPGGAGVANILCPLGLVAGGTANLIWGTVDLVVALVIATIVTYTTCDFGED